MTVRLTETIPLSEAGTTTPSGRMRVIAISAGLGSSGYYSPEILEEAAANNLIDNGTFLYLDHPSDAEDKDRPERSVRDIAAVFTESATYDADIEALVGEIQVFSPYRDLLSEMAPHIGLSIRGSATDVTEGEHDGKKVKVIEGLHSIDSVDFVTKAGRGGMVVDVLESAKAIKRAVNRGIDEATARDTEDALRTVLRDAHGSDDMWVWVRDFDEDKGLVWFEIESGDDAGVYGQAYATGDGGGVTLTGDRFEVRVETNYVPANDEAIEALLTSNSEFRRLHEQIERTSKRLSEIAGHPFFVPATRPDSTTQPTKSKENPMGKIQVEEAVHTEALEKAGRVDALQEENVTLKAKVTAFEEAEAVRVRTDRARELIGEAAKESDVAFTPLEVKGLLADLPLKEGALDEEKFTTSVKEDAAAKKVAGGAGLVIGMGGSTVPGSISWDDIDEAAGLEKQGA